MAGQMEVQNFSYDLGSTLAASSAGTVPMLFVPKAGGAITLLAAQVNYGVVPTGTINTPALITLADGATPTVVGTLGTAASWVMTSNGGKRTAITLSQTYVQPGTQDMWIGLSYGSGTILTGNPAVILTYMMGR